MRQRKMSVREYAEFISSTHPTVSKYIGKKQKVIQWDFLMKLSRSTHTDIGYLAQLAAPELVYEGIPSTNVIAERINQLPLSHRRAIIDMVNAYLYQQENAKDRE
jgi:predicted transcriptional regulator